MATIHELDTAQPSGGFWPSCAGSAGWTQRDLGRDGSYVSDKAVSKWERGLSLPDVALLLPLAGAAGRVGDRAAWRAAGCRAGAAVYSAAEVEALIRRALAFPAEPPERQTEPG